jgi:hypothetical protein
MGLKFCRNPIIAAQTPETLLRKLSGPMGFPCSRHPDQ